jgi:hypothetical protein
MPHEVEKENLLAGQKKETSCCLIQTHFSSERLALVLEKDSLFAWIRNQTTTRQKN